MTYANIIDIAKKANGYIYRKLIKENNIPTIYLSRMVRSGMLNRVHRGVYLLNGYIEDKFFVYSLLYKNFVYCHETALYLNELSNKQFSSYCVLLPYGAKAPAINNFHFFYTRKKTMSIGIDKVLTPYGNEVKCYSKERCICDLFLRDDYDYENRVYAINKYQQEFLNFDKLYECAKKLGVYDSVSSVFEVLGWN